ncbi:MAG: hypothetical protein ACPLKP_03245 [Microgenomates group bacterium]
MYNPSPETKAIIPTSNSSEEGRIKLIRDISNILTPENFLTLWGALSELFPDSLNPSDKKSKKPMMRMNFPQKVIELYLVGIDNIITTTNSKKDPETWIKKVVRITCLPDPQQPIPHFEMPPVPIISPIIDEEDSWKKIIEALLISYIETLQELQMPLEIEVDQVSINGLKSSATLAVPWPTLKNVINSSPHSPNSKRCFFPYSINSPNTELLFPCTISEKNENQQSSPQNLGEFTQFVEMLLRKRFTADLNRVFNEIKKIVGEYLRIANLPKDQLPQFTSELYLTYLRWIYQLMRVYLDEVISPLNDFLKKENPVKILW